MTTWLENQPKVRFVQKRLRNLDELIHEEYDFVINCTGVGARFLVNDTNIRPISGHVLSKTIFFLLITISFSSSNIQFYKSRIFCLFLRVFFHTKVLNQYQNTPKKANITFTLKRKKKKHFPTP